MCFSCLFSLDVAEDLVSIDEIHALGDDGVANLSDEDYKPGRSVVVGRELPNMEDDVHDGHKEVRKLKEVVAAIG